MRCVWLWVCVVLVGVLVVVAADSTVTPAPPPRDISCGENCRGTAVSSLLKAAGYSPACVASSLSLCSQIEEKQHFTTFVEEMREVLRELRPPVRQCQHQIIEEGKTWRWRPRHCKDLLDEGDSGRGVRQVYPFPGRPHDAADVYCDHTVDGGGWTVFQHRTNSTTREDFYRTWAEYQQGFGSLTGEFWGGLDLIHFLTSWSSQELRIELADYEGGQRWAKYSEFSVGPPEDNYRLTVGGYTGDSGDGMTDHNGQQFSTHDADHDIWSNNCAQQYKGGWWYKNCHGVNPNGYQYEGRHETNGDGVNWHIWKTNTYSLRNTTFMSRPSV